MSLYVFVFNSIDIEMKIPHIFPNYLYLQLNISTEVKHILSLPPDFRSSEQLKTVSDDITKFIFTSIMYLLFDLVNVYHTFLFLNSHMVNMYLIPMLY